MTDPQPPPESTVPGNPQSGWDQRSREETLVDWLARQRGSFTDEALERSAIAAGHTREDFARAVALAEAKVARSTAMKPIRSKVQRLVLAAYAVVWLAFAVRYLGQPSMYGIGPILQVGLTIALGVGLAISLLVLRRARPDPSRSSRAMVFLLVVPVVLLLGVAGLCLPFAVSS